MALLTRAGMEDVIKRIFETGEPTADMAAAMQRLRDDFDEREGILRRYGESYNGENKEYDFVESQELQQVRANEQRYRSRYEDLSRDYYNRFFNGGGPGVIQDMQTPPDTPPDKTDVQIDDFLYVKED